MDKEDILWIGTEGGGLDRFDTKTGRFRNFKHDPNNPYSIGSNYIHDVYGDPKGNLWIVTGGNGFYKFEINTERFICFKKASSKYSRIGIAFWGATYLDDSGKHWIGTANDGIYMYDPKKQNISTTVLYSDIDQTADVRAFYKDKKGKLWVSSTEGLFKFDQDRKTYTFNRYDRHHRNKLLQHSITSFVEDKRGFLWLGTEEGGLKRYNLRSGRIVEFLFNHENLFLTHPHWINLILKLKEDKKGNILIGNYVGDLIVFNKRTHKHKITIYQGSSFLVDHFKNLWRGYWGEGIKLYKDTSEETFHFFHTATDSTSLSSSYVMTIYEDNHNNIWIGTNNGLNLFNRETETFKDFTINDGLASDHILSILEDGHGSLWLCTPKGISRFNYLQRDYSGRPLIKNYQASDQVQFYADEIGYKDNEGFMYFGGRNGFVSFHPDSITENLHLPPIVLTDFKILNESPGVDSVGHSPLKSDISETQEINLSYDQNFFSFEFAALDYTDPMHNQYAYKMEGIDRDWTYTDVSHRHANYTDLDPGEYIFHVKGSNNEGLWNEKGKSLKIIINPPIWRTTWAYLLYFVALSAVLYAFRQYDLKRQRLKHELDLEHEHAEKLQEIDHIKSRFFANISHEFRTPLTLILGPIQSLIKKTHDVTTRNELSLMQRSALRLERLINQLLDLSKLEAGGMTIQLKEENIVDLVRNYAQSFESLAIQKDIKFIFKSDAENIPAFVDKNKIENILNNLLSNAFKFTPEGGKIRIR